MHAWCYGSIKTFPADNLRPAHLSTQYIRNIYLISTQYLRRPADLAAAHLRAEVRVPDGRAAEPQLRVRALLAAPGQYCTALYCAVLYCTVQVLRWFLNGAELQPGLVTAMEPVYPLEDKRGVARSLLKLPLTEETLPRYSPNIVSR